MHALEELHPAIYQECVQDHFVGQKTCHAFSSIAFEQMHEQLIGELNCNSDGIIGLKQNPSEILRHLVVGPDLPRLTQELEQPTWGTDEYDHEQYATHLQGRCPGKGTGGGFSRPWKSIP